MLGHSDIWTTQRYLNITDEQLCKALTGVGTTTSAAESRRAIAATNTPETTGDHVGPPQFVSHLLVNATAR